MTETRTTPCVRGCIQPRRHTIECVGNTEAKCRGCLPEPAEVGSALCDSCHALLRDMIREAPGQVELLRHCMERSSSQALTVETVSGHVGPRMDSDGVDYIGAAKSVGSASASEPMRTAVADAIREIEDVLSGWVETLASDYRINEPPRRLSLAGVDDPRRLTWRPIWPDGEPRSKFDPIVVHRDEHQVEVGQYVWIDPPGRFEVGKASVWLMANLTRLENQLGIGDELEEMSAAMGQAHALAPWRETATPLKGVPCPRCHRMSLVLFGGMSDVLCTTDKCPARFGWDRYSIWCRMYSQGDVGYRFEGKITGDADTARSG